MGIEKEMYAFLVSHDQLAEIPGKKDHPMIVLSHKLCGVVGQKTKATSIDEIPWCSSMMVLACVVANIRRNPKKAIAMLKNRGFSDAIILECFVVAGVNYTAMASIDTGKIIVPPTWSAAAKSWREWGYTVAVEKAERGDLACTTRSGGNHVACVDEDKIGRFFMTLFGPNQDNKICSGNWYARSRLVTVRRSYN